MRIRSLRALPVAVAAVALLAGCAEESGGAPGPASAPASAPAGNALPHSGTPKVENPIDTTAFEAEPCSVATLERLKEAGFAFKSPESDPEKSSGSACLWRYSAAGYGSVEGAFVSLGNGGLSDLYASQSSYDVFEEIPAIGGHPAIVYDTLDRRRDGSCAISIGLRDDQTYDVSSILSTNYPDPSESCEVARTVAEIAVETMKKDGA